VADMRELRDIYRDSLIELVRDTEEMIAKVTEEREFFLNQAYRDKETIADLSSKNEDLARRFKAEKIFTDHMFVKAEVSKICSKAVTKYIQEL
jgi:hypothetical protein